MRRREYEANIWSLALTLSFLLAVVTFAQCTGPSNGRDPIPLPTAPTLEP